MGSDGWTRDLDMEAIPRVGEEIRLGGASADDRGYSVRTVVHYLDDPDFDVYGVVR